MTFKLREILGDKALVVERVCATGKTPYATKAEADRALAGLNRKQTKMRRFRCPFCNQFHLGHRRGVV